MVGAVCRLQSPFRKKNKQTNSVPEKLRVFTLEQQKRDIRGLPLEIQGKVDADRRIAVVMALESSVSWYEQSKRSAYCVTRIHECMTCACVHRAYCCGCRHVHCPAHWVEPRLPLSSMSPPQPQSGTMLRRQVADTHQILAFH